MSDAAELALLTRHPLLNKRWLSAFVILMVYLGLALAASPDAYLSTDVGGKTASLQAMEARGDWNLDMGYWFENADPEGTLYPLAHSRRTANGQWVNTTSLPMVYAARPLWALGGPRLGLLLPIFGGVSSALVAGSIATRVRRDANGVLATWLVGLAGPVAIYAFDFWEHTLGLAAMAFGALMVMDSVTTAPRGDLSEQIKSRSALAMAVLAGVGYGAAATMRQEALVYGFVGGVVLVLWSWRSWGVIASCRRGAAMLVGTALPLAGHSLAEVWLLGGLDRLERSANITEVSASLSDRLRVAAATSTFPLNGFHWLSYVGGALLAISLAWAAASVISGKPSRNVQLAALVIWAFFGVFFIVLGPRFVPGLIPTTPLAVLGAVSLAHFRKWIPLALALGPIPLLFATQYPAGAIPQWGGRYLLLTGLVLVASAVALLQTKRHQQLLAITAVAGLAVTIFGISWSLIRMNTIAEEWVAIEELSRNDDTVVWRDASIAREAGPLSIGQRWISARTPIEQRIANDLFIDESIEHFVWIDWAGSDPPQFAGYDKGESLPGMNLLDQEIVRYSRTEIASG